MPALSRRLVAEFLGTFMLVFFGCGAVVMQSYPSADWHLMGVAVVHAAALAAAILTFFRFSIHFNPAVTVALAAMRRLPWRDAAAYLVVQLVAAVLAAALLKALVPPGAASIVNLGTPQLHGSLSVPMGIGVEALLAFLLVSAYYGTAIAGDGSRVAGVAIGLTLVFATMVGGPLTGAALNPARAFGPALVSGTWHAHVVYWVGPIVGALLAAVVWEKGMLGES